MRRTLFVIKWLLAAVFCLPVSLQAKAGSETGLYPVFNFSPKDYEAQPQNWACLQDQRGIMYFGNNGGIIEYDGANWNLIKTDKGNAVYSMDMDREGRIYLGSDNEFGYLAPDSIGRMRFVSLSESLPEQYQAFNDIWATHATPGGIIFQSNHYIFIRQDDSLHVIHSEEEIHESFFVDGLLYVKFSESSLTRLLGNQFIPVQSEEKFQEMTIFGMVELSEGKILIATERKGLFLLTYSANNFATDKVEQIRTPHDELLRRVEIYDAIRINGERMSIGTWGYGTLVIDTAYNLISILDKSSGMRDEVVQAQYVDQTGNLWLALSNGISRIEISSPITHFTDSKGLPGTVESITRFNDHIYATTNVGLYFLDEEVYNAEISDFRQPVFRIVPGLDYECWDMLTFRYRGEEILLVLTNTQVLEINAENESNIILTDYPYELYQSKLDSARVFVGLESGVLSLYRENGQWTNEGLVEGVNANIIHINEDHMGNLWMGTSQDMIIRMHISNMTENRIQDFSLTRYDASSGLPEGPFIISQYKGPPIVATNRGLYKYILTEDRFEPDSSYGDQFADGSLYIHRVTEFTDPQIWMVTAAYPDLNRFSVGYLDQVSANEFEWISTPFAKLSEGVIHAIYPEPDGIVWMGGGDGLYRFDEHAVKDYDQEYNAYIRSVELSDGRLIFGGNFYDYAGRVTLTQSLDLKPELPFRNNSLVFHFAAQPAENEAFTEFSYFLEGNDRQWSAWTNETSRPYTNLREGRYTFRVKARNIYGHESREASYEFIILAPWYRKAWAYILYIIVAVVIVYTIVKFYTRQLRQIIRERTAEVVMQKEVIEAKNKDIMDSINYAQKIQRALLPPEDDLSKLDIDGFVLFLPRDIVSGDFYWFYRQKSRLITIAADCTGHGVPGAFMSMLGVAFLNTIVGENPDLHASEILDKLRAEVITTLRQKGQAGEQKDGMDVALHIIDHDAMTLEFAGANNPLLIIRNNEIIQIRGDHMPIGIHEKADQPFTNHVMEIQKGDVFYTFSDGYQDQFGGPRNKKFMIKRMKQLLLENHQKPMSRQKAILYKAFKDWIEPYGTDQIDDVILIGLRV